MKRLYVIKMDDTILGIVDEKHKEEFDSETDVRDLTVEEVTFYETNLEVTDFSNMLWDGYENYLCG